MKKKKDLAKFEKIILPGIGSAEHAMKEIKRIKIYNDIKKFSKNKNPILGICLGHQSIGQAFGAKIIKCEEIMHGKIDKMQHNNHEIFSNVEKNFLATRYHSLVIDPKTLPSDFIITAETKNKIIMGIAHANLPIYGFQFHPESIGTDIGKTLLSNFLKLINYGN